MKLVATLFNSVAIVVLAAVLINPIANRSFDPAADGTALLLFAALASQIVAHDALAFFEAEERVP